MVILLNTWIFPIGQSGEASRWRVCYQRGVPRLVTVQRYFGQFWALINSWPVRNERVVKSAENNPGQ